MSDELTTPGPSPDGLTAEITDADRRAIAAAAHLLESPALAKTLADAIGTPIEKLLERLPGSVQGKIDEATSGALHMALKVATRTLREESADRPWNLSHKLAATLTGVAGGLFGAPALLAELPVTTVIMMRSIADIARSKGEDVSQPEARLACLEVFALGSAGPGPATREAFDATADHGEVERKAEFVQASYYIARAALARHADAVAEALAKGSLHVGGPVLTRFVNAITSRFGIAVTEKAAAQAVPVIGAVGGGLINALFMDHFQDTAEAHFTIRKLERKYGEAAVRQLFESSKNLAGSDG